MTRAGRCLRAPAVQAWQYYHRYGVVMVAPSGDESLLDALRSLPPEREKPLGGIERELHSIAGALQDISTRLGVQNEILLSLSKEFRGDMFLDSAAQVRPIRNKSAPPPTRWRN